METESRKFLDEWFEGWRRTDLLYDRFLKRHALNLTTYFVLELLYRHPEGVEPAVIAEKVFVLRQTVTVVLNEFEKRGFIRRCESQEGSPPEAHSADKERTRFYRWSLFGARRN